MNSVNPMNPSPFDRPLSQSKQPEVRTWRVGSLSMGITLMLIGTALAVSLWQDAEAYELLLWVAPVVFVLLGAELLIYLRTAGKHGMIVRYDWISVLFVGAPELSSGGLSETVIDSCLILAVPKGIEIERRPF